MFIKLAFLDTGLENPQDNCEIAALLQLFNSPLHQPLADPLTLKLEKQIQCHDLTQQFAVVSSLPNWQKPTILSTCSAIQIFAQPFRLTISKLR